MTEIKYKNVFLGWEHDEFDFRGVKLYSFNDAKEFCRLCYGEKSLKQFDGEKWFDPYPKKKRHARHIRKVSL